MERSLAHVERIREIKPIEGADKIEVATVLGWEVVIRKDEFKVDDQVVYVEIDSILPEKPEFEFMRERKFRVRTIKLRKQVSQGIVFPLSILPRGKYKDGQDVTELIGVVKYESPTERADRERQAIKQSKLKKFMMRYGWFRRLFKKDVSFPSFIPNTDETRLQNNPSLLEIPYSFSITEKLDGQSFTAFVIKRKFLWWNKYEYGICSRNFRRDTAVGSSWWEVSKKYRVKEVLIDLLKYSDNGNANYVYLQGEIIGPGIQKNRYQLKDLELYVFNLNFDGGRMLPTGAISQLLVLAYQNGLKNIQNKLHVVPVVDHMLLKDTVQEMVEYSKGKSVLLPSLDREGIVCRCFQEAGFQASFKVINPDYLLKYEGDE